MEIIHDAKAILTSLKQAENVLLKSFKEKFVHSFTFFGYTLSLKNVRIIFNFKEPS